MRYRKNQKDEGQSERRLAASTKQETERGNRRWHPKSRKRPTDRMQAGAQGRNRSKGSAASGLNALKHGLTAATVVLPHEDAAALEERVAAWKGDLRPAGAVEAYFVEQAAHASWQLDRANRTIAARLTELMQQAPADRDDPAREVAEVEDLARDLFWDPRGPVAVYPHPRTPSSIPGSPGPATATTRSTPGRSSAARGPATRLPMAARPLGRAAEDPGRRPQVAGARPLPRRPVARPPADGRPGRRAGDGDLPGLPCHGSQGPAAFADLAPELDGKEEEIFAGPAKGREGRPAPRPTRRPDGSPGGDGRAGDDPAGDPAGGASRASGGRPASPARSAGLRRQRRMSTAARN